MKQLINLYQSSFFIVLLLCSMMAFSQAKSHPLELVEQLQKTEKKNIVVFLHTDWCNYCKAMENATFQNKEVKELLEENFYFTELNGEEKADINFAGAVFKYKPTGVKTGFHELAASLGTIGGQVSYPSLVILSPSNEIIFQYNGFMTAKEIVTVLKKIDNG